MFLTIPLPIWFAVAVGMGFAILYIVGVNRDSKLKSKKDAE